MLVYFAKAAKKIADQPGMVLYGTPPRWHQFNPAVHTDQDQLHYHAKKATEIKAAKQLAAEHAGADQQPEDHVAALHAQAKDIQDKASASAAVTGWKAALLGGKKPSLSQAKAFHALAQSQPDKAAKLMEYVLDAIGKDKYEALLGQEQQAAAKSEDQAEAQPKPPTKAKLDAPDAVAEDQPLPADTLPVNPAVQALLDKAPKLKKVAMTAVEHLIKAAQEGNQAAFDARVAKAKAAVSIINGMTAVKLFQWADKVRAAAWPDATEPKPDAAESTKDTALQAAIDHLEEDKGQADIPPAEQKEDAALVAKLKAAQTAPADQPTDAADAAPKPKVVVTKPKTPSAPQADATGSAAPPPKHTFTNANEGMEAYVTPGVGPSKGKWKVTLKDLDSGQTLPVIHVYDSEDKAIASAKKAANLPKDASTPTPTVAPAPAPAAPVDTAKTVPQADAKPATPQAAKQVQTSQGVLAAKLDGMKLPTTNTNAKAVNAKIAKLEALVQAGDVAGLQAEKFGSNSYQKKLAKFAAEAATLLDKANPAQAGTDSAQEEDWQATLFGSQAATKDTTVTVNGQTLKKVSYGWEGPNHQSYGLGSPMGIVADLLTTGTVDDILLATASAKEQAVELAIKHGVDPLKALNKIAANPDGLSNPYDGDTHIINGVTYALRDGRWHRVSPTDDDAVTQDMKDAAINSLFDSKTSVQVLQVQWAAALANGKQPSAHEAGAYELLDAMEQKEAVAHAVSLYLDKITADENVKLYKTAKDAGAPHVWAYVADQLLAKHHATLKGLAQTTAPAAPVTTHTVTMNGTVFTKKGGAWYDDDGTKVPTHAPNHLGAEIIAGLRPSPDVLARQSQTGLALTADALHDMGVDPAQILNGLFPKGGASYGEGAVFSFGLVDMVLKNGKWEVKQDDTPVIAANQPGPQTDPVTAGHVSHVDDPREDFPGWYAAMLAGKTPNKKQVAAFVQALQDNPTAAVWAQQHLETTLGKAVYDLQMKPHFPNLYSAEEIIDVKLDWVTSLANGKAPTIKQALYYDSLDQDDQEALAYEALGDWGVDGDDYDAVDQAMDRLLHLQALGLNGPPTNSGSGAATQAGTAPPQGAPSATQNSVTMDGQVYTKNADGSWENATGSNVSQNKVVHTVLNLLSGHAPTPYVLATLSTDTKKAVVDLAVHAGYSPIKTLNAILPPGEVYPDEGDTKTINGVTYILHNGRWHRVTPTAAGQPDLSGADPNGTDPDEVSAIGYTAALLAQQVPTQAQHDAWLQALNAPGLNVQQVVQAHHDLVNGAIGAQKHQQLLEALHQQLGQSPPAAPAAPADTAWHQQVHAHLDAILAKIAPTNTNYKTIKAKVEKYKKLLDAGQYAEILNTNWGSNNYAKKIANAHGIIQQHANLPAAGAAAPSPSVTPTVVLTQPIPAQPDASESWDFDTSQQMGSNHGGLYTDKSGQKWYVKIPKSEAHARNELLAAKLYEAAGVAVPHLKLVKSGGKVAIASQWQDGMTKVGAGIKTATGALEGFAVDAWLANYDSVGTGYDNLLKDADGNAVRIDVGGSLLFRAQGAPKTDFGDTVNELQGMLDPNKNSYSAAVFGGITAAQLKAGAAKVASITPEQIKQMVQQYGPGSAAEKAALAERLIKRREDLLKKHPVAAAPAAPVFRVPTPPDFKNWNGPGQGLSGKAAYNEQNQQLAEAIYQKGLEGDVAAVENLTYQPITDTGAPTGSPQSIKSHPSKHIPAYLKDVINGMTKPYVSLSAQMAQVMSKVADDFQDLVKSFPGVKHLKDAGVKIGRYALVGKTDAAAFLAKWKKPKTVSKKQGTLSDQSLFDQSQANFKKLSAVERQAIKDYTGSSYNEMNEALIAGIQHNKAYNCIKGLEKASVPIPAGAVISRYCKFDKAEDGTESQENHKKAMQTLLKAGEGAILQEFGIISTSTKSTTWSGRVHLKITVGEGVKGLYVADNPNGSSSMPPISKNASESEIMLPYGTQFMVTKIHDENHEFSDATGSWGGNGATRVIEVLALPNADINMLSN